MRMVPQFSFMQPNVSANSASGVTTKLTSRHCFLHHCNSSIGSCAALCGDRIKVPPLHNGGQISQVVASKPSPAIAELRVSLVREKAVMCHSTRLLRLRCSI